MKRDNGSERLIAISVEPDALKRRAGRVDRLVLFDLLVRDGEESVRPRTTLPMHAGSRRSPKSGRPTVQSDPPFPLPLQDAAVEQCSRNG